MKSSDIAAGVVMKAIAKKVRNSYGARRHSIELKKAGYNKGIYATRTLMKKFEIKSVQRQQKKFFGSKSTKIETENKLNREFKVDGPNKAWCVDITYIQTYEGWLYLAGVIDLFGRKLIGYSMDKNMTVSLVKNALTRAIALRQVKDKKIIHHSDRGAQYVAELYQEILDKNNFIISLNKAGKCLDNAVKERFWGSLRTEWIQKKIYKTRTEAKQDILAFIDFYNFDRIHSTLGNISPYEFELKYFEKLSADKKVSTFT
jgi:putative transposase